MNFQEAIGNRNTPLLQCHGDCDPIVPYRWGQMTASFLKQFMTQTEFKTYRGMMHTSSEEVRKLRSRKTFVESFLMFKEIIMFVSFSLFSQEMRDIKKFIEKVLKP